MDPDAVARAAAAATSVATQLDLAAHGVTLLHNSNKLSLRLLPCDVFARVAVIGQEVAALEIELARQLAAADAPVAKLEPRVEPAVHHCDGFAVTLWTHYEERTDGALSSTDYQQALERLHVGLRRVEVPTPHFTDRIAEAEHLVSRRDLSPALDADGRQVLLDTFHSVREIIDRLGAPEQVLHGEPHPGNIVNAVGGPRFVDLETCCRGPVEFDWAHVPTEVSDRCASVDRVLLGECQRLVLAMVAAWRWDADDEFPDGLHHGRNILTLLAAGPPWPTIGALDGP